MNLKKLALGLVLSAAFGFVACGDDDESSPAGPRNDPAVSSSSVKTSGDTDKSSDSKSSAKSSDSKSSAKSSGSFTDLDYGDLGEACTKKGDTKDGQVMGTTLKLVCDDGFGLLIRRLGKKLLNAPKKGLPKIRP